MKKLITISLFCLSAIAFSQEQNVPEPMVTDRPDATEAPLTVPKGFLQVETGGFYTSFEENGFKTETYGYNTTLLRYGILDNFELRLGWNFEETRFSFNGQESPDVLSGFSPLLAGMKVEIADEDGWKPQIGLIGHLFLPFTAGSDYRPETTGADFRFSLSNTLSEKSSLSYNIGAQWGNDSPEIAYIYTVAYGYAVTDTFGLYAEIYGDFPEDSRANHLWDAGLTYLLKPNPQLDATVGSSFTEGQDILLSAGVSFRVPN
ncbi:transporter [Marinirhabdus gelatinilytica]|uniref:Outer membrane putative beta-barrel porin/alpha-amylase n=1 Tax=Marinirhabdus gelatinilytica TaxID=1703343 RepID=A0A370QJ66_9FLAO|nr:transporter [Marinirhabdus gelatinilytica]RDK88392.1 outer membrane putative beta-barrel porin/alpha-amylase [Marinirhabdus gelatinilytica]